MTKKTYERVTAKNRPLLVQSMEFSTSEKDHIRNCAGHETAITV